GPPGAGWPHPGRGSLTSSTRGKPSRGCASPRQMLPAGKPTLSFGLANARPGRPKEEPRYGAGHLGRRPSAPFPTAKGETELPSQETDRMPRVKANDIELHYVEAGTGSEPLVLIHGWISDSRNWVETIPRLPLERFHVFAFDLRGAGQSERPASGHSP